MKRDTCQAMEEWLVDFADETLTGPEADRVRKHVEQCPHCCEMVDALRQSLDIAQTIWLDNAQGIGPARTPRSHKWRYVAAAATILLAVGILAHSPPRQPPSAPTPTLAEIENRIAEAGHAARLLAKVQQLEVRTSRLDMARSQYRYIAERYPNTAAAESARLKLRSLR
jgi:hypothetical protein